MNNYQQDYHAARQSKLLQKFYGVIQRNAATATSLTLLGLTALAGYSQSIPNSLIIAVVAVVVATEFIRRLDFGVPLLQITAMIAVLQWLVGPVLAYSTGLVQDRYFMYVPEETYFQFALPATTLFCAGLFLFGVTIQQKAALKILDRNAMFRVGMLLLVLSTVAAFLAPYIGGELRFLLHLCSQLKYVGAIYFLLSNSKYRFLMAALSCFQLFAGSAETGLFHDLIIWLMLISTYWFAQFSVSNTRKALFVASGFAFVFLLQAAKQDFRDKVRTGQETTVPTEIYRIVSGQRDIFERDVLSLAAVRLNQGWIISAVLNNVPENESFANGETIEQAVVAALIPRFLVPDKKQAGGRENFRRFTGLEIGSGTSMGISPLGEAYANFGVAGGIGFMFVYGLIFSLLFKTATLTVNSNPDFIFWIPLIFYQGIKAETELAVVLNQVVKGLIVAYAGYYAVRYLLYPNVFGTAYTSKIQSSPTVSAQATQV